MIYTIQIEWNVNELIKHLSELIIFLKKDKLCVSLISETHFIKKTFVKVKGHQIYQTIHAYKKP